MLTSVNYISVTVWVLGGILALLAIGLIIYRFLQKNTKKENDAKNIGAVSKQMNEFIMTFSGNEEELLFHNILFKNKFSKNKFSVIPAMVVKGKDIFIITNIVSVTKAEHIIFTSEDIPYVIKGNKVKDLKDVNYLWYREIKRYLEWKLGDEYNIEVVCPILDNSLTIINNEGKNVCYASEIEEYLY